MFEARTLPEKGFSPERGFSMDELEAEIWADQRFSEAAGYLSERDIRTTGILVLGWLAAPHIALWTARSNAGLAPVWVISGRTPLDHVLAPDVSTPREALRTLGDRWARIAADPGTDDAPRTLDFHIPDDGPERAEALKTLDRFARMLRGIAGDESLWAESGPGRRSRG
jgi:hypothetical protein